MTPDRLHALLTAAASNIELFDDRAVGFLEDITERFGVHGEDLRLSERQWRWLDAIGGTLTRNQIQWEEDIL